MVDGARHHQELPPLVAAADLVGLVGLEEAGALVFPLLRAVVLVVSVLLLQHLQPVPASEDFLLVDRRLLVLVPPIHPVVLPWELVSVAAALLSAAAPLVRAYLVLRQGQQQILNQPPNQPLRQDRRHLVSVLPIHLCLRRPSPLLAQAFLPLVGPLQLPLAFP